MGKQAKLNVTAAYALDMAGFEHNPRTMYLAADLPFYALKNYHGVGATMMNDQIGLFTHQRLNLQYAYKTKLFGGTMSVGLQAGFLCESFDGSKVDAGESGDPALATSEVKGSGFDAEPDSTICMATGMWDFLHSILPHQPLNWEKPMSLRLTQRII